jgi:uncharacterized membrane protein YfcA
MPLLNPSRASGYLAAMAFMGIAPSVMKPTALVLNLLVATIATVRFARAGYFSWRLLWPFILGSIPLAFIGGAITLPGHWYKTLVGIVLILSAVNLVVKQKTKNETETKNRPVVLAVLSGGVIGILAGLTGARETLLFYISDSLGNFPEAHSTNRGRVIDR